MALLHSIATVGSITSVSRVFGFVRDILIAATLGAGMAADVFFVAFKFPNLFRRLFAEGAFSMAFVPIFSGILEEEGKVKAKEFADQALGILLSGLLVLVIGMEIAMPWAMRAFAPGFLDDPRKFDLAVELTRITFPYILLISLVSLLAGVLNSFGKFAAAAATPILLNLCLIGALLFWGPISKNPGHTLAWAVFLAGVVQFFWLIFQCGKNGYWFYRPIFVFSKNVKILLTRALPVALGAGIYQVNLLIDTIIASFLPEGSISYLFFADRINQLPLGVIGVAVGTALLPLLSRQIRAGDEVAVQNSQNRAVEFSILLALPAACALFVIADPVVKVLFQRGVFGDTQASATAAALAVFALALPAYVLIKSLAPGFFGRGDTVTPVKIAAVAMIVNVILSLVLMDHYLHVGIAMATTVSSWLNAGVMAFTLHKRGHFVFDDRLKSRLPRTLFASIGMSVALYFAATKLAPWLGSDVELERAFTLGVLVAGGIASYGVLAFISGAVKRSDTKSLY
jgi:putative peptidoglycan lipid II flippase